MFNFLDAKLLPKVTCRSACTEHYEPENLISANETVKARGYLAYTVIKPPVELVFEFLCPLNIAYINLKTSVGTQQSTGVEIFAKASNNSEYWSIAKTVSENSTLVFCNSKHYSKEHLPPQAENSSVAYFNRSAFKAFLSASSIKIRIFRTLGRSVPCLGSIQVFGSPAKVCSQTTIDTVNKLMGKHTSQLCEVSSETDGNTSNDFKIPDDFADDLTYEIMAIPMTLPSGKTVDRDTLEKHIQSEASFGRKPCDPFTGLKFTDSRKPVLNVALKSRIDMFLLQNSNNSALGSIKRTLGGNDYNATTKRLKLTCDLLDNDCDNNTRCCVCQNSEILYVIPCGHFFCRTCLLKLSDYKCKHCNKSFVKSQAVRFHI